MKFVAFDLIKQDEIACVFCGDLKSVDFGFVDRHRVALLIQLETE